LNCQIEQFIRFGRLVADALPQRLALQQLHGDERAQLVFANIVDDADIRVIQSRGGPGFPLKLV
jgi:hypothetical protein